MSPKIAVVIFAIGILGLFALDRNRKDRTSAVLWIPVAWLFIAASRPVSAWLAATGLGSPAPIDPAHPYLDGSPIDRNVFLILLIAGLIVVVSRRQQVTSLLRANGPVLLFLAYCLLSVTWSDYPDVAFKRWTKAVGDLVMVLIILTDPEPRAAIKRLLSRLGFLLMPLSILFIKYYPDLGRTYNRWTYEPSWTGVTTDKNMLGMACLILGLGALWRILEGRQTERDGRRTKRLMAQCTLLAMVFWLLIKANSMTSLACFVLSGALLATLICSSRAQRSVHFLSAAAIGVAAYALFLNRAGSLIEDLGRNSTLTGRTEIWSTLLRFVTRPLLGTGYASFWLGDPLHTLATLHHGLLLGINEAHNGYLEVYLNLGWIGVFLLAVVIVTGYKNVVIAFRNHQDAASLKLACFIAAVIYNFTESAFKELNPVWIFFLLAIFAIPYIPVPEARIPLEVEEPQLLAAESEPQVDQGLWVGMRRVGF